MILRKSIDKFKEVLWLPAVLLHLILPVNTKFTLWPEMVVYPYLINNGFLLYKDIINPYPPIFIGFLALFAKTFGYLPTPYQILTWGIIFIADIAIFIVVQKLSKNYYHAFFALLFFAILSVPFGINGLWFDLIQTPLGIFSVYYFLKYLSTNKSLDLQKSLYLAIITFFIKQQVLWLVIFYSIFLFFKKKSFFLNIKNLFLPLLFFCMLALIHLLFFYRLGLLNDFIYWTIYQPLIKGSSLPGYVSLPTVKQFLIIIIPFLINLYIFCLSKQKKPVLVLLPLPFIMFAFPRFDYFHLAVYLAVVSILLGLQLKTVKDFGQKAFLIPAGLGFLLFFFTLHYLKSNWQQPVRFFERDIFAAASFLDQTTPKNSIVYIQNGPDQLLSLSGRLPVKPWAIQFPWYLEIGDLQSRTAAAIKSQNPAFVIFKPYTQNGKYSLGSYRPIQIANYLDENYVNLIQINDSLWLKVKK